MPYYQEYCEPEFILSLVDGTKIHRDYKNGEQAQPLTCWYQLQDRSDSYIWVSFDVRDLPLGPTHQDRIRAADHAAQKAGLSFLDYLRSCSIEISDAYG